MQYSAEAWMQGVPLNYGDVQRYAHLAPPGEAGMAGWSAPTMPDLPGAYLQQAYMPMPDYRQAAAAAGLGGYPPLFDYAQLTEAQLAAHLGSSQPSLAPPTTAAPQLLSVNHRTKLALNPHRPLHPTDPADDDDEPSSLLAAAGEPITAELPSTTGPSHYLNKASLQLAAAAGQLPYPPSLQQFRHYPQLRHPPPALVPYHPYPYAAALSQPQDFDDAPPHDPALATSPPILPSLQPSLSRPGPSNAEVAQQLGDDIADHFVRVERKITCPTYCKRLHVTQFMAENLLPTDQTKDRAKGPLCYNYELLFKHKIWLIDEDLVSWPVEYEGVVCCAQRHYRLTSGWRNFVRAKSIKVGDTVVMERRGRNRHNVYVKVVEGNATPATPPKAKAPRLKASLARNDDTLEAPDAALASP